MPDAMAVSGRAFRTGNPPEARQCRAVGREAQPGIRVWQGEQYAASRQDMAKPAASWTQRDFMESWDSYSAGR